MLFRQHNRVYLEDSRVLDYDVLIIATGTDIAPEEIDGMMGDHWHKSVFDFYTLDGAVKLHKKLENWKGGHLAVHITEMPIKCPVAPLEFTFLADAYFEQRGIRDKVKISFVTPMDGAFTKPVASAHLGHLLEEKGIEVVPNFNIMSLESGQMQRLRATGFVNLPIFGDIHLTPILYFPNCFSEQYQKYSRCQVK